MAISTVRGAFSKVTGTIVFDDKDITKSTVDVTIDVTTVDTREPDRDNDLRSDKFFDVAHYPYHDFQIQESRASRSRQTQGHRRPHHSRHHQGSCSRRGRPDRSHERSLGHISVAAVCATTKINRQDFGVKWNATLDNGGVVVGDDVSIIIDVEMVKKDK